MLLTIPQEFLSTCVQLLAAADVLFTPLRLPAVTQAAATAVAERRGWFRQSGLPWLVGGSGAARVAGHRQLQAIVAAGLVVAAGTGRDRSVKLTKGAEAFTRAAVASYVYGETEPWALLERVADYTSTGHVNAGHVLELDLLGITYKHREFHSRICMMEEAALPLLVGGYLHSAGDLEGAIGYSLTEAGKKMLAAGRPDLPPGELPYDEAAADQYGALLQAGLRERESWQPSNRSLVAVPLGAGSWPARRRKKPIGSNGHA